MVRDILLDETGDLAVSATGDLVVGFADNQHIEDVVMSAPGNWQQHPLVGLNATRYINAPINSTTNTAFKRNAKLQLENDGAEVQRIEVGKEWMVNIKAEYPAP